MGRCYIRAGVKRADKVSNLDDSLPRVRVSARAILIRTGTDISLGFKNTAWKLKRMPNENFHNKQLSVCTI